MQTLGHHLATALGVAEHNDALRLLGLEDAQKQPHLGIAGDMEQLLVNLLHSNLLGLDGNLHGILGVLPGQVLHIGVEGGAEEHGLAVLGLGQHLDELAKVRIEAHVEHAVRLVHHQKGHLTQVHGAGLLQVDDTARRADDDVNTFFQQGGLLVVAHSAVEAARLEAGTGNQCPGLLLHLHCQLPGGNHNQGLLAGNPAADQQLLDD